MISFQAFKIQSTDQCIESKIPFIVCSEMVWKSSCNILSICISVAVKVEIKSPDSRTREWSQQFVKRLNDLKDKTIQRSLETHKLIIDLKDGGIEILKSTEDKDAVVWIWCKSSEALQKLRKMSGFENIAKLFCQLTEKNSQFSFEKNINVDRGYG